MKALVLKEYRQFALEDFPVPTLQADDVLVRVRACGICGSDVHGMDGSTGRRIPPVIMGHEASGVIAEAGSSAAGAAGGDAGAVAGGPAAGAGAAGGWHAGDRVTFDSMIFCGECW